MYQKFLPSILSRTMRDSYDSLPKREIEPYHDDEKQPSTPTSISITDLRHERSSLLKQCFTWLTLAIIFIFLATTTLVLIVSNHLRHNIEKAHSHSAPHIQPLNLDLERQRALAMLPSPANPPKHAKSCGPDAATAIAQGCHLDMISFTWLPHECYDADLTAEFLSLNPWQWSRSENGTELVTREAVERGEVENGWVTWEYHITHCLYTWKKLVRHLERGGAMDWYVMEYSHARHCSGLLLQEGVDRQTFNSEFFVQYPLCGYA